MYEDGKQNGCSYGPIYKRNTIGLIIANIPQKMNLDELQNKQEWVFCHPCRKWLTTRSNFMKHVSKVFTGRLYMNSLTSGTL